MTLFGFFLLLVLGKGNGIGWNLVNMDQYVHDSKEASGPVSLHEFADSFVPSAVAKFPEISHKRSA